MEKYRGVGRPSPIDWPQAVALGLEAVGWCVIVAGGLFLLALDWTTVGVTP
jgi:hypothetical protein